MSPERVSANNIGQVQNYVHNLRRLVAQRRLYTEAKRLQALLIVVSTLAIVFWSVLALFYPVLKPYASLWACSATLLDVLFITPLIKDKKSKAARFQEEFDCEVLDMPWCQSKVGDRPEPELLGHRQTADGDPELVAVRNWYPKAVHAVPLHLARLLCQRSCCWWERSIRQKCQRWSLSAVVAAMFLIVVFGMAGGVSVQNAVSVVLLIQPSLILLVRLHKEHYDAAENAERLRKIAEGLWQRGISGSMSTPEVDSEARLLQNEIFDHRTRSPLVFDWLYNLLRSGHEKLMQSAIESLADDYLRFQSRAGSAEQE